jgi:hypothetical protein
VDYKVAALEQGACRGWWFGGESLKSLRSSQLRRLGGEMVSVASALERTI